MIRGGLRTRLIMDSTRLTVIAGLTALGWFDPTIHDTPPGVRSHRPLRYVPMPTSWDDQVEPNSIAVSLEETYDDPAGLGGEVQDTLRGYIDVFSENDQFGWQVVGDVRDILIGMMPDLGRDGPVIDIYDFRLATPAPFTTVDVVNVVIDRAESEARNWQNHWFMVRFDLEDEFDDEFDSEHPTSEWTEDYAPAWARIQATELA